MDNLTSEIDGLEKLQPKGGAKYGYDPKRAARIEILKAQRMLYERQLYVLLFPPYWRVGIFAFIYFAIVGVLLPLMIPLIISEICLTQLWIFFVIYISGFVIMFIYLWKEIKTAILKD